MMKGRKLGDGKILWSPTRMKTVDACEKHYAPRELAELWGLSKETIRTIFRNEPGVLKIGSNGTRLKRGYKTLRIPQSVAERVHTRLSA
jgi:hypothetical protein